MTYRVEITFRAAQDLGRLIDWLAPLNARAAARAQAAIRLALASLDEMPFRHAAHEDGFRYMSVRFGRRGYVVRYRVEGEVVEVLRIWHALEDRR